MTSQKPSYHGYRFPPEIISHAVWLYHRCCLSFRDVEDLLAPTEASRSRTKPSATGVRRSGRTTLGQQNYHRLEKEGREYGDQELTPSCASLAKEGE